MQSSVNNMRIQIAQLKESLLDNNQQDVEKFNNLRSIGRSIRMYRQARRSSV
jgi:hypothetical protein